MVTVCQKCGDYGIYEALIYCVKCQVTAEHFYCLDELPESFNQQVSWACDYCVERVAKQTTQNTPSSTPSTKSDQICLESVATAHPGVTFNKLNISSLSTKMKVQECESSHSLQSRDVHLPVDMTKSDLLTDDCSLLMENMSSCYENQSKRKKFGKRRRLILDEFGDGEDFDEGADDIESAKVKSSHAAAGNCSPLMENMSSCYDNHDKQKKFGKRRRLICDESHVGGDFDEGVESPKVKSSQVAAGNCSVLMDNMSSCYENHGKHKKFGKRRRLICDESDDWGDSGEGVEDAKVKSSQVAANEPSNTTENNCNAHAQPIFDPIWRGSFNIYNGNFGTSTTVGLAAHLSSKACFKVFMVASLLPAFLQLEMLPRLDAWPKSFDRSKPTDDNIALYFFQENQSDDRAFDILLDDIIHQDLAMKAVVDNAVLLIFTSIQLPPQYWRFEGKHYLWGMFKGNKASALNQPKGPCFIRNNSIVVGIGEERTTTKSWDMQFPLHPLRNNDQGSIPVVEMVSYQLPSTRIKPIESIAEETFTGETFATTSTPMMEPTRPISNADIIPCERNIITTVPYSLNLNQQTIEASSNVQGTPTPLSTTATSTTSIALTTPTALSTTTTSTVSIALTVDSMLTMPKISTEISNAIVKTFGSLLISSKMGEELAKIMPDIELTKITAGFFTPEHDNLTKLNTLVQRGLYGDVYGLNLPPKDRFGNLIVSPSTQSPCPEFQLAYKQFPFFLHVYPQNPQNIPWLPGSTLEEKQLKALDLFQRFVLKVYEIPIYAQWSLENLKMTKYFMKELHSYGFDTSLMEPFLMSTLKYKHLERKAQELKTRREIQNQQSQELQLAWRVFQKIDQELQTIVQKEKGLEEETQQLLRRLEEINKLQAELKEDINNSKRGMRAWGTLQNLMLMFEAEIKLVEDTQTRVHEEIGQEKQKLRTLGFHIP